MVMVHFSIKKSDDTPFEKGNVVFAKLPSGYVPQKRVVTVAAHNLITPSMVFIQSMLEGSQSGNVMAYITEESMRTIEGTITFYAT